ncbi:MAG TPA: PAS domain-containing sensor histidine kinase, partial [Phototrophicaceae bacterium]|nr:PAS domain-containing sensor histidine kinase [Phototrophicaceae bacterium]
MEFPYVPSNSRKSIWSNLADDPRLLRLRMFWRWLTIIHSDDPVRRVLNRGFITVLIILTAAISLLLPVFLLSGELSAAISIIFWVLLSLFMGWLNRQGTTYGAAVFTILFVLLVPLALPAANYVGTEADSSLSLLLAVPIIAATLFIRPAAGLVALGFQILVTAIAISQSDAREDLATGFVINLTENLLLVTGLVMVGARIFGQALRNSIAANAALREENAGRRQTEIALRESEQALREVVDATFEGIAIHEDGTIVEVNQSFCSIMGYSRHELIGMRAISLIIPDQHEMVRQRILTDNSQPYEITVLCKDGTQRVIEIVGKSFTYKGTSARIIAVQETYQRKLAEEQRLELALVRQKNEILKEFLNTISHDLKTPLAVIYTSLYLYDKSDDPGHQRQKLEQIRAQAEKLDKFVQNILTVARLDNPPAATFHMVDLKHLADNALQQFRDVAGERQQTLKLEIVDSLPLILVDENEIQR